MKRIALRVAALSAVVVLGVLAIAQAQRSLRAPDDAAAAAEAAVEADAAALGDAALEPIGAPDELDDIPPAHEVLGSPPATQVVQAGYREVEPVEAGNPYAPAPRAAEPPVEPAGTLPNELPDRYAAPNDPYHAGDPAAVASDPYAAADRTTDPYAAPVADNSADAPYEPPAPSPTEARYADAADNPLRPSASNPPTADEFDAFAEPTAAAAPPDYAADAPPQNDGFAEPPSTVGTPEPMPSHADVPANSASRGFEQDFPADSAPSGSSHLAGFERDDQFAAGAEPRAATGTGKPGSQEREGSQSPSLSIEKIAPAEVQVGRETTFKVIVRNVGDVPVRDVELHDEVPQGAELVETTPRAATGASGELVWSLGTMQPGDESTVELALIPRSEGELGSVATVRFHADASVRTIATRPELVLDVEAPADVLAGEEAVVTIRVANEGSGAATGVVVEQALSAEFEHPSGTQIEYEVGDLAPHESREVQLTLTAVEAGATANRMRVRADGDLIAEADWELEVVAPALEVALDGAKRRFLEREATYTVVVSNPGTAAAHEVELAAYLPPGFNFVSADNYGEFDPQTRGVHWSLEELPPGEQGTVTFTAVPVEPGELKIDMKATAARGLSIERAEPVTVEGIAAVLFQVVDVSDPIEVGGETTYEIRVVNQGTSKASNVRLRAVLPPEMKPVAAEGPTRHLFEGNTVTFEALARLAPKADTTYRIRAQGLAPGDLRISVQLLTDDLERPVTKEESTQVFAAE